MSAPIVDRLRDAAALPNGLYAEAADTITDLQRKLWMLASHATGGSLGALPMEQVCAMSTNDIAVQISAFRTKLWNEAKAKGGATMTALKTIALIAWLSFAAFMFLTELPL